MLFPHFFLYILELLEFPSSVFYVELFGPILPLTLLPLKIDPPPPFRATCSQFQFFPHTNEHFQLAHFVNLNMQEAGPSE
jgi:hypothetical protein